MLLLKLQKTNGRVILALPFCLYAAAVGLAGWLLPFQNAIFFTLLPQCIMYTPPFSVSDVSRPLYISRPAVS